MQASVLYVAQADNCSRPFAPKAAKSALAAVVARGPCGGFSVVVSSSPWQKLLGTEIGLGLCRCCGSLRKASISGAGADAGRPASHAPRAPVRVDERSNVHCFAVHGRWCRTNCRMFRPRGVVQKQMPRAKLNAGRFFGIHSCPFSRRRCLLSSAELIAVHGRTVLTG